MGITRVSSAYTNGQHSVKIIKNNKIFEAFFVKRFHRLSLIKFAEMTYWYTTKDIAELALIFLHNFIF